MKLGRLIRPPIVEVDGQIVGGVAVPVGVYLEAPPAVVEVEPPSPTTSQSTKPKKEEWDEPNMTRVVLYVRVGY